MPTLPRAVMEMSECYMLFCFAIIKFFIIFAQAYSSVQKVTSQGCSGEHHNLETTTYLMNHDICVRGKASFLLTKLSYLSFQSLL